MSRMSTPSIFTAPSSGSKTRCRRPSVVDFPEPVEPTSAIVSPGLAVKRHILYRLAASVVGKGHIFESDRAGKTARVARARPVGDGRAACRAPERIRAIFAAC